LGIPILGEWPGMIDWVAISLISAGVYIVSGGPLPRLRKWSRGKGIAFAVLFWQATTDDDEHSW